jgi:hypothetical protein
MKYFIINSDYIEDTDDMHNLCKYEMLDCCNGDLSLEHFIVHQKTAIKIIHKNKCDPIAEYKDYFAARDIDWYAQIEYIVTHFNVLIDELIAEGRIRAI